MARYADNGARSEVEELLAEFGLPDGPDLRELAAQALDPDNPLRELDLIALHRLAEAREP